MKKLGTKYMNTCFIKTYRYVESDGLKKNSWNINRFSFTIHHLPEYVTGKVR